MRPHHTISKLIPCLALDILVVDPSWQRQGAGRMLVKWGTSVADRMRVEVRTIQTLCLLI